MRATATSSILEARLLEVLMGELAPCDLGKGIEVVHDVEAVEIEMDCDVDDEAADIARTMRSNEAADNVARTMRSNDAADNVARTMRFDDAADDVASTLRFAREAMGSDELGTHEFARFSAPYERIELAIEPRAFVRATIEEAKTLMRSRQS